MPAALPESLPAYPQAPFSRIFRQTYLPMAKEILMQGSLLIFANLGYWLSMSYVSGIVGAADKDSASAIALISSYMNFVNSSFVGVVAWGLIPMIGRMRGNIPKPLFWQSFVHAILFSIIPVIFYACAPFLLELGVKNEKALYLTDLFFEKNLKFVGTWLFPALGWWSAALAIATKNLKTYCFGRVVSGVLITLLGAFCIQASDKERAFEWLSDLYFIRDAVQFFVIMALLFLFDKQRFNFSNFQFFDSPGTGYLSRIASLGALYRSGLPIAIGFATEMLQTLLASNWIIPLIDQKNDDDAALSARAALLLTYLVIRIGFIAGVQSILMSLAGAAVGAQDFLKAARYGYVGIMVALLLSLVGMVIILPASQEISHQFVNADDSHNEKTLANLKVGMWALMLGACAMEAVGYAAFSILNALKKAFWASWVQSFAFLPLSLSLGYLIGVHGEQGLLGFYGGNAIAMAVFTAVVTYLFFHHTEQHIRGNLSESRVATSTPSQDALVFASQNGNGNGNGNVNGNSVRGAEDWEATV